MKVDIVFTGDCLCSKMCAIFKGVHTVSSIRDIIDLTKQQGTHC